MENPRSNVTDRFANLRSQRGQVVVEYILLLGVLVAIAAVVTRQMVHRNPDAPGFLIQKWDQIIEVIAKDLPDE